VTDKQYLIILLAVLVSPKFGDEARAFWIIVALVLLGLTFWK
jgi:hypothetical protein